MLFGLFVLSMAHPVGRAYAEEDYSQGMVDRPAAMAAADAVTSPKYPDADQVIVDSMRRVCYKADGTYVQWEETWAKGAHGERAGGKQPPLPARSPFPTRGGRRTARSLWSRSSSRGGRWSPSMWRRTPN